VDDNDWSDLVRQIKKGKCTPFLGAGINAPFLPSGDKLARELAESFKYPFDDAGDLIKVTQYVATVRSDPTRPKREVLALLEQALQGIQAERVSRDTVVYSDEQPIGLLASLPFAIYITTNYDPLMYNGLIARGKAARREICRWDILSMEADRVSNGRRSGETCNEEPGEPKPAAPMVFHLHGADLEEASLVLTEDDYTTFLVNLRLMTIPDRVRERLSGGLLFLGYSFKDWDFRVLHQAIVRQREATSRYGSISVQLPWEEDEKTRNLAMQYLDQHFGRKAISVYWGTAQDFLAELTKRCNGP
jgi:hypothetical protein